MFKHVLKYTLYLFLFLLLFWCSSQNKNYVHKKKIQDKEVLNTLNTEKKLSNENKNLSDDEIVDNLIKEDSNIKKYDDTTVKNSNIDNLSWDNLIKTGVSYTKLEDLDLSKIKDPKGCLKINFRYQSEKKDCIYKVEQYIIDSATSMTTDTCKKLITHKNKQKCFDDLYFYLATKKLKLDTCNFISDKKLKDKCIKDISLTLKIQEQNKDEEKKKSQKNNIVQKNNTDCSKLKTGRTNCFVKLAKKANDLRYCTNNLSWKDKNKCINDIFNDVLKYNLKKAIETKDPIYCDKIWIDEWIKKCKNNL